MDAFAERVARRFELDAPEAAFLEQLQANRQRVERGRILVAEGDRADHAFVLVSGWAMSGTHFPDGTQQVRRLHFPGDLLAMPSLPLRRHAESLEAISDAIVAPFPKDALADLFTMPRLAAIMFMFAQMERVAAGDRLASLGHDSAKSRLAFFLVDILNRLRSTDPTVTDSFHMHLSREQVAQVIGTTAVHASRMWSALLSQGLIRTTGRSVKVIDEVELARLGHFTDRDGDLDHAWLEGVERRLAFGAASVPQGWPKRKQ